MILDPHYQHPDLVALYDLDSGWSVDRDYYLALATTPGLQILDLGCGTGLLCRAFAAQGHRVTGVDPAAEMLSVGQAKDPYQQVTWLQATAQNLSCEQEQLSGFDLITMTGHAFQVLLSEADLRATFRTVKKCLADQGQFVFESRNPDFDWASCWDYTLKLPWGGQQVSETRRWLAFRDGILHFELVYQFPQHSLSSNSRLRFWSRAQIEALLREAGLTAQQCLGDWHGASFETERSQEMIFHVTHA